MREFYNSLPECCKPKTPTNYIYEVFLWRIIEDYKTDCCTRENAIELFNNELVEAFNIFSECYAREDVIKRMARLYRYRPLLTDDNSFNSNIEEEYVYEGHRQKIPYQKYLSILKNYYTAYVDGTFIYNALSKMQKEIDENIYELLCGIASQNHTGVQYDTIFSIRKDKRCLPRMVQQKLFKTNPVSKIFEIQRYHSRRIIYFQNSAS